MYSNSWQAAYLPTWVRHCALLLLADSKHLFMHFMILLTAAPRRNDERMRLESEMANASSQVCLVEV